MPACPYRAYYFLRKLTNPQHGSTESCLLLLLLLLLLLATTLCFSSGGFTYVSGQPHSLSKANGHGKVCVHCKQRGMVTSRGKLRQTRFKCWPCNACLCRWPCFVDYHKIRSIPHIPPP